jgi:ERCC4-type nuclease
LTGEVSPILVSPAETHPLLRTLGESSSETEARGVDFLMIGQDGLVGIQRKTIDDLIVSLRDGRIAKELGQMAGSDLVRAGMLIEGAWHTAHADFTRAQYDGIVLSLQMEYGLFVLTTGTVAETAETLRRTESWMQKHTHGSLGVRPKSRALWGTWKSKEWSVHLLSSFDGLSVGRAGAIYDAVGLPLAWTVEEKAMLAAVKGLGRKTTGKLYAALPPHEERNGNGSDAR